MSTQPDLLSWQDKSVTDLEEAVRYHNTKYWVERAPEISDVAFDQLVEALRRKAPQSPVLTAIGPAGGLLEDEALDANAEKVAHDPPMLSLDKGYDEATILKWFDKFSGDAVASPKVDGVAICLRYDEQGQLTLGATRGTGAVGEVITQNIKHVAHVPHRIDQGPLEVRGEAYMPLSVFKGQFEQDYMSPRNLTAGALKRKEGQKTGGYQIAFFAYDVLGRGFQTEQDKQAYLRAQGFEPVPSALCSRDELQRTYERFAADRHALDYETDGVVFKANVVAEQQRMGANSHHPRYAIAYKYQGDSGRSVLRHVEWGVSRTGSINPVGVVDPVELSGASVTRVSLHNLAIMEKLGGDQGLRLGSTVLMMRRGGVIPNLECVLQPGDTPVELPAACPVCGAPTYRKGDFLFADHHATCGSMRTRQLEHFIKVFDIKGFGQKIIEQVYDAGLVVEYEDLFTLKAEDLKGLDRMGDRSAKKLIEQIDLRREVPVDVFLRAFGIHELGKHVSAILASTTRSLDEIWALSADDLAKIHTIGEVIATHVAQGLASHRPVMERVLAHVSVTFPPLSPNGAQDAQDAQGAAGGADGPLSGKSFLFTGTLESMTRKDAQLRVEAAGGQCPSSISKTLSFLVIGDEDMTRYEQGWRSSKLKKAEQLIQDGAPLRVIGEREFLSMIQA